MEFMWIVYMVLSVVCISVMTIVAKIAMSHAHYHVFNLLRTIFVVATAWIIVMFVGSAGSILNLNGETWICLILSGITTACAWNFFYKALAMTEIRKVVPIDSTNVIIAFFLGILILGDSVALTSVISMITIGFGIIMMIQKGAKESKKKKESKMWIVWALLGATFTALTNIIGGMWVSSVEANLGAAIRVLVILVIMIGVVIFSKNYKKIKDVDRKGWILIGITGVLTVLSWFFFNLALVGGIGPIVGASGDLSMILTLVLSFIILKEKLTKRAIIGAVQFAIGIIVMII